MRCASYNHFYTPNSKNFDCINNDGTTITAFGWRGARSNHTGGVNVLFGDGSVHFISDAVDPVTWTSLSTRSGGEVPGNNERSWPRASNGLTNDDPGERA
jgi:prepilin-type processing-associated H-X9-DG protein